jgi:hypothetical protein
MGTGWDVYILVFIMAVVVMARLDRLGKQIEAVHVSIKADLARTDDDRQEIIDNWKENRTQEAKDQRMFWLFWGFVAAAVAFGFYFVKHPY